MVTPVVRWWQHIVSDNEGKAVFAVHLVHRLFSWLGLCPVVLAIPAAKQAQQTHLRCPPSHSVTWFDHIYVRIECCLNKALSRALAHLHGCGRNLT